MTANELGLQMQFLNLFVYAGLDAPHIREDCIRGDKSFYSKQIFRIVGNRRAQKKIVAVSEGGIDIGTDLIYDSFLFCKFQRGGIDIIRNQTGVWQTTL